MPFPRTRHATATTPVLLALGSNRPHGRHGPPPTVLRAAIAALAAAGVRVRATSRIRATAPLGPSSRTYANATLIVDWPGSPQALLALTQSIEQHFGRRRARRWAARVLDIDILAMGNLTLATSRLTLPHPALHLRAFVLDPLLEIAPRWRHPILNATIRALHARLHKPRAALMPRPRGAGS
ncbi:2-amino-4-hydroxy-6-hydroxymethyldihydropteridine diphosphokinase [Sandaracinobacteroides saxicola]|uniref:2-amino-4-hydroxy-6-hydroxymethyldihydropteridine pyrophosphokinase n=1 Tax=Sandaracinobacteroides saxicola TaxID=2759707 RepID=A0A7G5IKM9_9SPHN|nr:2-amino-4-hydroxy-6-hydroxymethyldihydropteridine diphosphokinase [Sandaracinobacteroides saxicola]QMW23921.1 2-amino-4-hydroxy-6-hydroxymethyldihydropteridine diphosphokinase [Sandaracinobacteroides saxicola]